MIFPIIFAIAAFILGFTEMLNTSLGDRNFIDYVNATLIGTMLALLSALLGAAFAHLVGAVLPKRWSVVGRHSLAAMNGGSGIKGQFYLGRGTINGGWAYHYYTKSGEQLYPQQLIISENDVAVTETNDDEPRLEVSDYDLIYDWMYLFGSPTSSRRFRFFVPKGSVKESFDI